jgi:hypothetical protein
MKRGTLRRALLCLEDFLCLEDLNYVVHPEAKIDQLETVHSRLFLRMVEITGL